MIYKNKFKNALIIVNPASGKEDFLERKSSIEKEAGKFGWKGEIEETTLKKSAFVIARRAIRIKIKHIIVCGGDGTLMEVISAAVGKSVIISVVPMGTGNLLAKNLKIPLDYKDAVKTAFLGTPLKIDVGKANGTFFAIMAGIGFDAQMMRDADRDLKSKIGVAAYVLSGLKNLLKTRGEYRMKVDRKEYGVFKAKSIIVANMGKITGGIKAVPTANPKSGSFKIGIIKANTLYSWANIAINALQGNINKSQHYILLEGKHIEINSLRSPMPYECDGNNFKPTHKLVIDIFPGSVNVLIP